MQSTTPQHIFETTVQSVAWNINKTGILTPIVHINANGNITTKTVTGYNAKWVQDKHIAKGAKIAIELSKGITPVIAKTIYPASDKEEAQLWESVCLCPYCGHPTIWDSTLTELRCDNSECSGAQLARLGFFFKTVGATSINKNALTLLYNDGYRNVKDFLYATFEDLSYVYKLTNNRINLILDATQKIKAGVEVTKLMYASCCFDGIGQTKAQKALLQLPKESLFAFYNGNLHTWANNDELRQQKFFTKANTDTKSFMLGIIPFYNFVATNRLKILPLNTQKQA